MHVGDVHEQTRKRLFAVRADQAKFACGLHCIDGVRARVRQTDDLRLALLRGHHERCEIGGRNRMLGGAQHLAAVGVDDLACLFLQAVAEGVVGGQKEPVLAAALRDRAGRHVGERVGVIHIVHGAGHAQVVGQAVDAGAVEDDDLVLLLGDFEHRERGCGHGHVHERIDLASVEPFARLAGRDVGLVLVIGGDQFDLLAQHLASEIIDGHLHRRDRAGAGDVGEWPRQIGDHAETHDVVGDLRVLRLRECGAAEQRGGANQSACVADGGMGGALHGFVSWVFWGECRVGSDRRDGRDGRADSAGKPKRRCGEQQARATEFVQLVGEFLEMPKLAQRNAELEQAVLVQRQHGVA